MGNAPSKRSALITGASAGIGFALAHEFARAGYNLILTARRLERLDANAQTLRTQYGVEVEVIAADLAQAGSAPTIFNEITRRGLTVDALVNNAGYGVAGHFENAPWQAHRDFIEVMVTALCELTYLVLPGMRARKFGRILNVASIAGFAPAALGATLYPAAKSFVIRFSQSLALETRKSGIYVTALCPGFTHTEFHDAANMRADIDRLPGFMWMDAQTVAAQGFRALERGDPLYINGGLNRVLAAICKHTPNHLALWIARKVMSS